MRSQDYKKLLDELNRAREGRQFYKNLKPFVKDEVNHMIKLYNLQVEELEEQLEDIQCKGCISCKGSGKIYWLLTCKKCNGDGVIYSFKNIKWLQKRNLV